MRSPCNLVLGKVQDRRVGHGGRNGICPPWVNRRRVRKASTKQGSERALASLSEACRCQAEHGSKDVKLLYLLGKLYNVGSRNAASVKCNLRWLRVPATNLSIFAHALTRSPLNAPFMGRIQPRQAHQPAAASAKAGNLKVRGSNPSETRRTGQFQMRTAAPLQGRQIKGIEVKRYPEPGHHRAVSPRRSSNLNRAKPGFRSILQFRQPPRSGQAVPG
jgi:hypothetical protein